MDFGWIFMDFDGMIWILMILIFMDFDGMIWILMDFGGF